MIQRLPIALAQVKAGNTNKTNDIFVVSKNGNYQNLYNMIFLNSKNKHLILTDYYSISQIKLA